MPRKYLNYRTSERFTAESIEGIVVTIFYTEDLTDDAIVDSYRIHIEKENYEYCAALVAEADKRGWKIPPTRTPR